MLLDEASQIEWFLPVCIAVHIGWKKDVCVLLFWSLLITIFFLIELSRDQIKFLEGELQVLRDEVQCLTEEDSRKKEQMEQLYETFSKEKSDLEKSLEAVSVH